MFRGRAASLTMANDVTERKRIEHRDAALAKLGQSLSSATSPEQAATIIRAVADDLFHWDTFTLDLYLAEQDQVCPILNVDTNRAGERFEIPVTGQSRVRRRTQVSTCETRLSREGRSVPARRRRLLNRAGR